MKYDGLIPTAEPFFFPGNKIGCLLVHGFTGTPKEMRWLGEYLSNQGYTVMGLRLFAHATKVEDMNRARWTDWMASVEDGMHMLCGSTERIFIMGLSMGGLLSMLFAAQFPVDGIVIMAAPHHMPPDPRARFIKPLSFVKPSFPKGPPDWHDQDAYKSHVSYMVDPTRAYIEVREMLTILPKALPKITAPALLIYSKHDQVVNPEERHMEMIYEAIGSQDKECLWLEEGGHNLARDAGRQFVFKAVSDFVARKTSPAR